VLINVLSGLYRQLNTGVLITKCRVSTRILYWLKRQRIKTFLLESSERLCLPCVGLTDLITAVSH